jgi:hypothetical protein
MPRRDLADVEQRLRRLPTALTVAPPAGLLERVVRRSRRRRRRRRVGGGVLLAALLAAAVTTRAVVGEGDHHPDHQVASVGGLPSATAAQLARGHWRQLPAVPGGRGIAAIVWAGDQLLVWGDGSDGTDLRALRAGGWSYDARSGRWRPLPPAPMAVDFPQAVWTGREVLVVSPISTREDPAHIGLAYDPARRTWRRLPGAPLPPAGRLGSRLWTSGWTGRELVVVTGYGSLQQQPLRGAAYNPVTNRWRRLASSPTLAGSPQGACCALWAGTRLLVWTDWNRGEPQPPPPRGERTALWAYDPAADHWTVLPAPSDQTRRQLYWYQVVWTGQGLIGTDAWVRYDPEHDRLTPIAPPLAQRTVTVGSAWTGAALVAATIGEHVTIKNGKAVVVVNGKPTTRPGRVDLLAWDPPTDRWLRLGLPTPAPGWVVFWTGLGLLVWNGDDGGHPISVLVPAAH